ncbi:MAG: amidase [Gemmataceae bacterium]
MLPTIHEAAALIRAGKLSSHELLETCLANIDRHEGRVRAWVLVDRDRARADARTADDELARGVDRGPLHGIPVGIKDIIDVSDWPTACGSKRWANAYARQDAPVVSKLRHAGAVLIGKTVTTAYASFDPPPTRNPWDLSRTPGGSSSGSAAAVAAGMCLAALGTQTGGSITRPAAYCGVVACKPSYGKSNLSGILPLAPSLDHVGPIGCTVRDIQLVTQAISEDSFDKVIPSDQRTGPPRLGRLRGFFDRHASDDMKRTMDRVCGELSAKGATIEDVTPPAEFADVIASHRVVMAVEAAKYHGMRLRRHPDEYGPNVAALIEEGLACPATAYGRALDLQRDLREAFMNEMMNVGTLLCPAATGPAPDAATTGDPAFNSPWSFAGLPLVSLPVGFGDDGLPLGVQFVCTFWPGPCPFSVAAWAEEVLAVTLGTPRGIA